MGGIGIGCLKSRDSPDNGDSGLGDSCPSSNCRQFPPSTITLWAWGAGNQSWSKHLLCYNLIVLHFWHLPQQRWRKTDSQWNGDIEETLRFSKCPDIHNVTELLNCNTPCYQRIMLHNAWGLKTHTNGKQWWWWWWCCNTRHLYDKCGGPPQSASRIPSMFIVKPIRWEGKPLPLIHSKINCNTSLKGGHSQ